MPSTAEIQSSVALLNADFVTKRPTTVLLRDGNGSVLGHSVDYDLNQVGVVTVDRPGQATQTLQRFRYRGQDQWEAISDN